MASLSLKHIYKKYPGGVVAVSDFCLEVKDSPHELCLQPLPQVLIYAPIGIAAFVADFLHRQVGYVASVMLQDKFHSVGVALRRG